MNFNQSAIFVNLDRIEGCGSSEHLSSFNFPDHFSAHKIRNQKIPSEVSPSPLFQSFSM